MMRSEAGNQNVARGVAELTAGRPLIFPTDTVYGIGVAVGFSQTPEILYDIKQRDHGKPVAWLVGNSEALDQYGEEVPKYAHEIARVYWPGQLTLIVKAAQNVPETFCSPEGTIALRMPDHPLALELIERVGVPIATTSANISGKSAPKTFGELDDLLLNRVSVVLCDEGAEENHSGVASSVIDCTTDHPIMVREGDISMMNILGCPSD